VVALYIWHRGEVDLLIVEIRKVIMRIVMFEADVRNVSRPKNGSFITL